MHASHTLSCLSPVYLSVAFLALLHFLCLSDLMICTPAHALHETSLSLYTHTNFWSATTGLISLPQLQPQTSLLDFEMPFQSLTPTSLSHSTLETWQIWQVWSSSSRSPSTEIWLRPSVSRAARTSRLKTGSHTADALILPLENAALPLSI